MKEQKVLLMILDGWGLGPVATSDAIQAAHTPVMDNLMQEYPHTTLFTFGEEVGLPDGQMGNSEVGHLNLGAGRIVYQELQRINMAIRNGDLGKNEVLQNAFIHALQTGKKLHFIGLVSDGGVHAHIDHIKALSSLAQTTGIKEHFIHAFTDGRDTDPKGGYHFLNDLETFITPLGGKLASITGRYFAMDRDQRWERVKIAYDALCKGQGEIYTDNPVAAIQQQYEQGITDEFLKPIINTTATGEAVAQLETGDVVICFNFRTDRCREITQVLTQLHFPEYEMSPLDLHYITMTEYDHTFKNVGVLFHNNHLQQTLGETLSNQGKTQLRVAETEKYPHVTFFFSGGREEPFGGEERLLIPSPKSVATYDLQPEMSALEITDALLPIIENSTPDFICLNFANADMVGHTGVWEAAVKAVETVDTCVGRIAEAARAKGYALFILADHGNSDYLINEDGSPNTAHTMNPVPFIIVSNEKYHILKNGKLGDIAPTILHFMGLEIPAEMTGQILISE